MPLQIREPPLKPNLLLKKAPSVSTLSSFRALLGPFKGEIAYLLLGVSTSRPEVEPLTLAGNEGELEVD